jgi:hypothetical protein
VPRTYVTSAGERLPARECATCATLLLDESLGRTDEERKAIRRVIASRSGKVVPIRGSALDPKGGSDGGNRNDGND